MSVILSLLLIFTAITSMYGDYEEKVVSLRGLERYRITIDFKVLQYGFVLPSLEVLLSNSSTFKVYLNSKFTPLPGFYLFLRRIVERRHAMLCCGSWYELEIHNDGRFMRFIVKVLNSTFIVTRVHTVPVLFSQGLTYGGGYWYFTGTASIYKLSPDMSKVVEYSDDPIPVFLKEEGYFHLGDLDYYRGLLLIPIEKTGYVRPAVIACYNASTLELVRYAYVPQDHMPWIAVDGSGYIYTSEFSPVREIYVYHVDLIGRGNSIEPTRILRLSCELRNVQGGVVLGGGKLLLSADDGDNLYVVDLRSGEVSKLVTLPGLYEMEGIEFVGDDNSIYVLVNTHEEENIVYELKYFERGSSLEVFRLRTSDVEVHDKVIIRYRASEVVLGGVRCEATGFGMKTNLGVVLGVAVVCALLITLYRYFRLKRVK